LDLRRQLSLLRQWVWLLVLSGAAAGGLAYVLTSSQQKVYEAQATVIVGPSLTAVSPNYNDLFVSQQLAQTYAQIARTPQLLARVAEREHLSASGGLLATRVFAAAPLDSVLITITVQCNAADLAARIANDVADELVAISPSTEAPQQVVQAFVDQEILATQQEILDLQTQIQRIRHAKSTGPVDAAALQDLDTRLSSLRATYASFLTFSSRSAANVLTLIQPATPPEGPSAPRTLINTILAIAATVSLVLGWIFARDYLDDRVKRVEDVEVATGQAPIAVLPEIKATRKRGKLRFPMLDSPLSQDAEAFRSLRTNLEFARADTRLRSLLVTSWLAEEGKTTTAGNLAVAFAQAGRRTILVDADLYDPGVHRMFGLSNVPGLTALLETDAADPSDLVRATSIDGLALLTTGPLPPNPAELIHSGRMQALLVRLEQMADLVIIDGPPMSGAADAAVLSTMVSGTLLIVRAGRTRRGALRQAMAVLARLGAHLRGVAVNRATRSSFSGELDGPYTEASYSEPVAARPLRERDKPAADPASLP
jgi:capsular exopolysaccharide synthesis family protein